MLRNFLYLNTATLDGYVSAIEDGLRSEIERESGRSRDRKAGADVKVVTGELGSGTSESNRTRGADTPAARFSRLLAAAADRPEELGWIEVVQPEVDLDEVGLGAMLHGEADFYIPQLVQLMSQSQGGIADALDQLESLEPFAEAFGLDTADLPSKKQRKGMRAFTAAMKTDLVTVGEFDDSAWKVAGQLVAAHQQSPIDGPARFVGKVSKIWPAGEGRPLLALPGSTLLPRAKRRELERQRPSDPDDDSFLMGPAVMLDMLAIWR
ncbi:DUF6414 family protein [Quadrisphaera oryzae]|uniref:DUF6414 family protein n=1 Tax=Quadrisphaera TaxID=317661 RepID=UPI001649626D|nr:hypothetical protein [Quadrisphaera sp. RL12-1S]MBC3761561.1 hypothetical protein [Quadrisphaera sp. RL12-1S]